MKKTLSAAAFAGVLSLSIVPAFAQGAAAPEPPQGAQPMDNAGSGSSMGGDSMSKSSMKKSSKHHSKHHHMKKKSM